MKQLEKALNEVVGIGPGFDTLRVGLSISVVLWHSVSVSYGAVREDQIWHSTLAGIVASVVLPMFFSLSGFLVIGSALRTNSLKTFLSFRILRIVPALMTEVILSALVLGPLFTNVLLSEYFSSPVFYRYFANIAGVISFNLPGVFTTNPSHIVNFSLWTIPPELACYGFLAICMATGVYRRKRFMLYLMFAILATIAVRKLLSHNHVIDAKPGQENLFLCFILGNLIYLFKEKIYLDWRLFCIAFPLGAFCVHDPILMYAGSFLLAYCAVFLGMSKLPRIPLLHRGDYSYGIYLYGYPIQQAIIYLFPSIRIWYLNAIIALPLVIVFAMGSWHIVEKPALALKRRFQKPRVERVSTSEILPIGASAGVENL